MKQPPLPKTLAGLRVQLVEICPYFAAECTVEELAEREREKTATFHFVLQPFTTYFGADQSALSDKQLKQLADLVNRAVEGTDDLENAMATCFLEHLRQIRAYERLAPLLSAQAKQKTHA